MQLIFQWERIGKDKTYRARVLGGWLVRDCSSTGISVAFVPDPDHIWEVVIM